MTPSHSDTLEFRRQLPAPPHVIFGLWTKPEAIRRWFGGEETPISEVNLDLRPGGEYSITIEAEGGRASVSGHFIEVDPPRRLRYTWVYTTVEGSLPETTVEVEFESWKGGTQLVLRHGPFVQRQARQLHHAGWDACFATLEAMAP